MLPQETPARAERHRLPVAAAGAKSNPRKWTKLDADGRLKIELAGLAVGGSGGRPFDFGAA